MARLTTINFHWCLVYTFFSIRFFSCPSSIPFARAHTLSFSLTACDVVLDKWGAHSSFSPFTALQLNKTKEHQRKLCDECERKKSIPTQTHTTRRGSESAASGTKRPYRNIKSGKNMKKKKRRINDSTKTKMKMVYEFAPPICCLFFAAHT